MIRLVFLLRRRDGLTLDEFHDRWRLDHGPLVASHQTRLGILRYTQSHRLDDPLNAALAGARGGMEAAVRRRGRAVVGVRGDARRGVVDARPGGAPGAELLADEAEFIDLPASPLWLAHEYPQVNPTPEHLVARPTNRVLKLHFPLRHRPELSLDDAQRYWRTQHGPLIRSMAPAMGMLRYQQVHRFESPVETALRDGPRHGHRGRTPATPRPGSSGRPAGRAPEAAEAGRRAIADEASFIDLPRSAIWIGKEHVFIDRI